VIDCPVCKKYKFQSDFDLGVCSVCGWENDGVQLDDPDFPGGANDLSLNEYKVQWENRSS